MSNICNLEIWRREDMAYKIKKNEKAWPTQNKEKWLKYTGY